MKSIVTGITMGLLIVIVGMVAGCQKNTESTPTTQYTCPMHSEVMQAGPGKCPKCGMDLVAKQ